MHPVQTAGKLGQGRPQRAKNYPTTHTREGLADHLNPVCWRVFFCLLLMDKLQDEMGILGVDPVW